MIQRKPQKTIPAGLKYGSNLGFTLIELMIVVAIIAIILTLALPVYTSYTIRTKIGEALAVGASAKTATASTCVENPTLTDLDNNAVGYGFEPSTWVQNVQVTGECTNPVISITTQNTGAPVDPVLTLTGTFSEGDGAITWVCATNGEDYHVPTTCRS